jgi:hypothetical protein
VAKVADCTAGPQSATGYEIWTLADRQLVAAAWQLGNNPRACLTFLTLDPVTIAAVRFEMPSSSARETTIDQLRARSFTLQLIGFNDQRISQRPGVFPSPGDLPAHALSRTSAAD